MPNSDQFPVIAKALVADVESSATNSKRLKLRTLLAKFGFEKRSDRNTADITKALNDEGLAINPPLVRYGDTWEISTEDWIYLSTLKESADSSSPRRYSPAPGWNADGWFDGLGSLELRTEKEVGIKFVVPLLSRLGFSDQDRFDGMPIKASHGSRETTLVIDHAVFNSRLETLKTQPLLTVEAKRDSYLLTPRQLDQAHNQAKSYCFWAQCRFFMITDGQRVHVYRVGRGSFDNIESLFEAAREGLRDCFADLYALVSKQSLTDYYLRKLSTAEEAL